MTGFGRTGAAFAAHRFGVDARLFTFAKGVTSAYVPLGGVAVRESLACTSTRTCFRAGTPSRPPARDGSGRRGARRISRRKSLRARARDGTGCARASMSCSAATHRSAKCAASARSSGSSSSRSETREPLVPWQGNASAATASSTPARARALRSGALQLRDRRAAADVVDRRARRGFADSRRVAQRTREAETMMQLPSPRQSDGELIGERPIARRDETRSRSAQRARRLSSWREFRSSSARVCSLCRSARATARRARALVARERQDVRRRARRGPTRNRGRRVRVRDAVADDGRFASRRRARHRLDLGALTARRLRRHHAVQLSRR